MPRTCADTVCCRHGRRCDAAISSSTTVEPQSQQQRKASSSAGVSVVDSRAAPPMLPSSATSGSGESISSDTRDIISRTYLQMVKGSVPSRDTNVDDTATDYENAPFANNAESLAARPPPRSAAPSRRRRNERDELKSSKLPPPAAPPASSASVVSAVSSRAMAANSADSCPCPLVEKLYIGTRSPDGAESALADRDSFGVYHAIECDTGQTLRQLRDSGAPLSLRAELQLRLVHRRVNGAFAHYCIKQRSEDGGGSSFSNRRGGLYVDLGGGGNDDKDGENESPQFGSLEALLAYHSRFMTAAKKPNRKH